MTTEPKVLEGALTAMLAQHPDALVSAIDEGGLFVAVPDSLVLGQHRVARARSALDLVEPAHRATVISAWAQVKAEGAARAVVTVPGGGRASLHFFDVRAAHGVYVGIMIAIDGHPDQLDEIAEIPSPPPRLARTRKNELAVIIDVDTDLTAMLGWDRADIVGERSLGFIHPDDQDRAINTWMDVLAKPGGTARCRVRHKHRDGHWVWLEIANKNLLDQPDGYVDCEMLDISEEMEAQEAVRASEQLLRRLAGALPVGVVQFGLDRRLLYVNEQLREILGAAPDADLPEMLAGIVDLAPLEAAVDRVLEGEDGDIELRIDRGDGTGRRLCTLSLRALTSPAGEVTGAVGCLSDVTESSRMRSELEQRATFDGLTGCINRATTIAMLDQALAARSTGTGVVFIDLDGFKAVNDQYGHAIGDTLLVTIGARLRDTVRAGDVVGRIGGDEFLVVCSQLADATAALSLAERVADALSEPLDINGATLRPQASIGVAWAGDRAHSSSAARAEALIAEADGAMYASKRVGEGRPVLASWPARSSVPRVTPTGDLVTELQQAIARHELEVHYQPVVGIRGGGVIGFEALLRWRRQGQLVPAAGFIGAAETTGLICEVGPWVIDEVCRLAVASRRPDLTWFVNLSPRELAAPRTVAAFGHALDRHGIAPAAIVVEITEHAALVEGGIASGVVAELDRLGVGFALDDFGTGHSSLSTLLELPARWLKIDRRFTAATCSSRGRGLLAGIVDLAKRTEAETVAEGVETRAELAALADLGVDFAQGYLFARPAPMCASEVMETVPASSQLG